MPLEIIEKVEVTNRSPVARGPTEIKITVENTSSKTIIAWRITGLVASSQGFPTGWSSGSDAYSRFPPDRPPSAHGADSIFAPGEIREMYFPRNAKPSDGPYRAVAIEVSAVAFADGSLMGSSVSVNHLLEARILAAQSHLRQIATLENMLTAFPDREQAIQELEELLGRQEGKELQYQIQQAIDTLSGDPGADVRLALEELKSANEDALSLVSFHLPADILARIESLPFPPFGFAARSKHDTSRHSEIVVWSAEGSDEAFLVLDRNGNGTIDNGLKVFGDVTPQLPSDEPNGFRALQIFDDRLNGGNEDGWIDADDPIYPDLQLWVDSNHDGVSQPEELSTLRQQGIEGIDLAYQRSQEIDEHGNALRYWSSLRRQGEGAAIAWNVFFVQR